MIAIRAEIDRVGSGRVAAPTTSRCATRRTPRGALVGDVGPPVPARAGGLPGRRRRRDKYWPPVRRIDQAYGDRNLVCACPPPEAFED